MNNSTFERFQVGLQEKRQVLTNWLRNTPEEKRQARLGPADSAAVQAHVATVDTAIHKAESETLGICTICHEPVEPSLLEMDYTASVCLAHYSSEEVNRLESELEMAQSVQRALLPHRAPAIPGVQIAALSRPAEILGGDFFDFPRFKDGVHGFLIGDVAGKGVSAGLLMASVQASATTLALDADSPAHVLSRVNHVFCHNIHMTTFVTLFLAHLDPIQRTLTYSNAGHNPPLLLRGGQADREITWLGPTNPAIGLVENSIFKDRSVSLVPDDILVLYTDGVTEAQNLQGEEFGQERLADCVRQGASAREIVLGVEQGLREFTAGQPLADDTTIVACRIAEPVV